MITGGMLLNAAAASAVLTGVCLVWVLAVWLPTHGRRLRNTVFAGLEAKDALTPNEVEFFGRLRRALPQYTVLAQVPLSALVKTTLPESHPDFWQSFDRFSRKVADFVVVDSRRMRTLAVIELDDRTHDVKRDKDRARDALLRSAGIPTVRWDSRAKPSVAAIQSELRSVLAGHA